MRDRDKGRAGETERKVEQERQRERESRRDREKVEHERQREGRAGDTERKVEQERQKQRERNNPHYKLPFRPRLRSVPYHRFSFFLALIGVDINTMDIKLQLVITPGIITSKKLLPTATRHILVALVGHKILSKTL